MATQVKHIPHTSEEGTRIGRLTLGWRRLFTSAKWEVNLVRWVPGFPEGLSMLSFFRVSPKGLRVENFFFPRYQMTPRFAAAKALRYLSKV